jgi:adenylate kinase
LFYPASGRVYHRKFKPPNVEEVDDVTGEPLIVRKDDMVEVFEQRMREYDATFEPVLDFYSKKGLLFTLLADGLTIDQITEKLREHLLK